ncbi:MAG: carboxypeptidase-like regulatory domain-containing protein [Candidatus Eremiobacteraeota bacterium]|nr:carboxypeptidase-like regulatory domain-containing protein [Candidatus Eremiobacteraeota bacterium]
MKRFSGFLFIGLFVILLFALTYSAFSQEASNKQRCRVYGWTYDSDGGVISNVTVTIGSFTDFTGSGAYKIKNVPPGTHTIKASCSGYRDYMDTITIQPGQKELKKHVRLPKIEKPAPQQVTKCRVSGEIRGTLWQDRDIFK